MRSLASFLSDAWALPIALIAISTPATTLAQPSAIDHDNCVAIKSALLDLPSRLKRVDVEWKAEPGIPALAQLFDTDIPDQARQIRLGLVLVPMDELRRDTIVPFAVLRFLTRDNREVTRYAAVFDLRAIDKLLIPDGAAGLLSLSDEPPRSAWSQLGLTDANVAAVRNWAALKAFLTGKGSAAAARIVSEKPLPQQPVSPAAGAGSEAWLSQRVGAKYIFTWTAPDGRVSAFSYDASGAGKWFNYANCKGRGRKRQAQAPRW